MKAKGKASTKPYEGTGQGHLRIWREITRVGAEEGVDYLEAWEPLQALQYLLCIIQEQ